MRGFEDYLELVSAAAAAGSVDFLFRDDDVAEDCDGLKRLLDIFGEKGVPLNLEVIPGLLTPACSSLLLSRKKAAPSLIELNQHGWMHLNHEASGRKCEFGPSRSFPEQLSDIRAGRERLLDAFGGAFNPVFTPPWNRCTTDTCRALEELDFRAVSALKRLDRPACAAPREISVTIDLLDWKNGPELKPATHLLAELSAQVREGGLIGILLHHQVMRGDAFDFIAGLVERLGGVGNVRYHTFESILDREDD